jgi:hypothetical protein
MRVLGQFTECKGYKVRLSPSCRSLTDVSRVVDRPVLIGCRLHSSPLRMKPAGPKKSLCRSSALERQRCSLPPVPEPPARRTQTRRIPAKSCLRASARTPECCVPASTSPAGHRLSRVSLVRSAGCIWPHASNRETTLNCLTLHRPSGIVVKKISPIKGYVSHKRDFIYFQVHLAQSTSLYLIPNASWPGFFYVNDRSPRCVGRKVGGGDGSNC